MNIQMKLVILLLCMVQYVYGGCLVNPDPVTGHVSAADLSAALEATLTPTIIGSASYWTSGFYYCKALKSIEIPASVTTIKKKAFYLATNLKNITFLGNIDTVEGGNYYEGAFYYTTNLENITFMGTVGTIGPYAFYSSGENANSMSVDFRGDVDSILQNAFDNSGLTSVTYGGTKGSISTSAFSSSKYVKCRLDEPDPGMNLTTGHGTYGGLTSDSFEGCGFLTSVTIGNSVVKIGYMAFRATGLTSVTIPSSVTEIDGYAFYEAATLTSVDLSSATLLEKIGSSAFKETGLTSVTIPSSVIEIGQSAFSQATALTSVDFSGATSLKTIDNYAFYNTLLTSVTIPDSVISIGEWAFSNTPLTSVTIPSSVKEIGSSAFYSNQLTSLIIPESVHTIGSTDQANGAFGSNPITELAILGTPTFHEYYTYGTFNFHGHPGLQLERYCFNYSALPVKIQNQLDMTNAEDDCTFWCETGTGQISTNYNCTKPWSTACNAGFYFAPKPAGMQVSMSDTCTPCPSGKFQPNSSSVATSCTPWTSCPTGEYLVTAGTATANAVCAPWTTENGKRLVTAGTALADAVWEDAPIASPSELNTTWSGLGCTGGETYQSAYGTCDVGKICLPLNHVLECPPGALRLNETHCSSEKEVVYDALKSHCPL